MPVETIAEITKQEISHADVGMIREFEITQ
jgi:hypothetical protein